MGQILRARVINGQVKYISELQSDQTALATVAQFVKDNEGQIIYKEFHDANTLSFSKNLPLYFKKILVPPIFAKIKDEYGMSTQEECISFLSIAFGSVEMKKKDGTAYKLNMRIEEMQPAKQAEFIGKVANYGIQKFGLTFPNANELAAK